MALLHVTRIALVAKALPLMKGQSLLHARQDVTGEAQHLHCLQESHCRPVRQLLFNAVDASCSNLFATVGGDQANVYDDMHMGDYIAVVLNFVNARTSHAAGQVGSLSSMLLYTLRPFGCRVASYAHYVTGCLESFTSLPAPPRSQVTRRRVL